MINQENSLNESSDSWDLQSVIDKEIGHTTSPVTSLNAQQRDQGLQNFQTIDSSFQEEFEDMVANQESSPGSPGSTLSRGNFLAYPVPVSSSPSDDLLPYTPPPPEACSSPKVSHPLSPRFDKFSRKIGFRKYI